MITSFNPGARVEVCIGSGLRSEKQGTIIPWLSNWRQCQGLYRPPDRKREVWIEYDDGEISPMYKDRLRLCRSATHRVPA